MGTRLRRQRIRSDSKIVVVFADQDITWTRPGYLDVESRTVLLANRKYDERSGLFQIFLSEAVPIMGLNYGGKLIQLREPEDRYYFHALQPSSGLEPPTGYWDP